MTRQNELIYYLHEGVILKPRYLLRDWVEGIPNQDGFSFSPRLGSHITIIGHGVPEILIKLPGCWAL